MLRNGRSRNKSDCAYAMFRVWILPKFDGYKRVSRSGAVGAILGQRDGGHRL